MTSEIATGNARHTACVRVPFADVDHAGIVYYPKIFHYAHLAYEDWLRTFPQYSLDKMMTRERIGTPVITSEAVFQGPIAHGEMLDIEVVVERVGNRSFSLGYRLCDRESGAIRARVKVVHALVSMDSFESIPIPDALRTFLEGETVDKETA